MRRLAAVLALVLGLAACSSGDGDEDEGRPSGRAPASEAAMLPGPRTEVAGAAWQGGMAAAGGITRDGAPSARVDLYDPAADKWHPGPPLPIPLHHVGLATLGDRLYVAGGYAGAAGGEWVPEAQVFSLGPGETSWREEPNLAEARGALALAATGDRLVAMGGVTSGGVTASTEVLTPGASAWQPGPDLAQAREHFGAATSGDRVYAIAGRVGGLGTNMTSVESWDPTGSAGWREEPSLNDSRGGTAAATLDGSPCVAGGEEPGGTIPSVECLRDGRWQRVGELRVPRHGLAVAAFDGLLHVVGGGPTPGLSVSGAHEVFSLGG